MSDGQTIDERPGFAETPSKDEWLGLLRDMASDLDALETTARNMRERIHMIMTRIE